MKRIISFILTVMVLLSVGFSSASATTTEVGSTSVTAAYVAGSQGGQVISVDVAWENMEFTYNGASAPLWDAEKHQYVPAADEGWEKSDAYISITNHSNVILQAEIAYAGKAAYKDMSLAFTDSAPFIGSAATKEAGEGTACEVIIRAIPTGKLKPDTPADTKVGEIKVTVAPVEDQTRVLGILSDAYDVIPVKSNALSREDVCFKSEEAMTDVGTRLQTATDAINSESFTVAQKNAALNELLSGYYSQLHFMQDFPAA